MDPIPGKGWLDIVQVTDGKSMESLFNLMSTEHVPLGLIYCSVPTETKSYHTLCKTLTHPRQPHLGLCEVH